jgi:ferredoxin-NADP reductase
MVSVGKPRNNFELSANAKRHLLLAGGSASRR